MRPAATYSPTSELAVPSALWGLTAVFGMGTGMTPTLNHRRSAVGTPEMRVPRTNGRRERRCQSTCYLQITAGACLVSDYECGEVSQATRAISTARLHSLRCLHLPPINVVISHGPSEGLRPGSAHLGVGF